MNLIFWNSAGRELLPEHLLRCLAAFALAFPILGMSGAQALAAPGDGPAEIRANLEARVKQIEREVEQLRQAGQNDLADEVAAELKQIQAAIGANAPFDCPKSDEPEVHLVYLSSGSEGDPKTEPGEPISQEQRETGRAEIHITQTARPVILAIAGFWSIDWQIKLAPGARLERVLVSPRFPQTFSGLPEGVTVDQLSSQEEYSSGFTSVAFTGKRDKPASEYALTKRRSADSEAMAKIRHHTGSDLRTILGDKSYPGEPFVIGPENPAWRDQYLLHQADSLWQRVHDVERTARLRELADIRFRSVWSGAATSRGSTSFSRATAEFTLRGPILSTMAPVPQPGYAPISILEIPQHDVTFAIDSSNKLALVEATGTQYPQVPLPPGTLAPRFNLGHMALDTKRERLVLTAGYFERLLMAYDLEKAQWSRIRTLPKEGMIYALGYVEKQDTLYGLLLEGTEGRVSALARFDAAGKLLEPLHLSSSILVAGNYRLEHDTPQPMVHDVEGLLVVTTPALLGLDKVRRAYVHVIDPVTGEVLYSGESKPHYGQQPFEPSESEHSLRAEP